MATLEFASAGMLSPTSGRLGYAPPEDTYAGTRKSRGSKMNPFEGEMLNVTWQEEDFNVPLPAEVNTALEWSATEIKLPKIAHMNLTYGEFVAGQSQILSCWLTPNSSWTRTVRM